MTAVLPRSILPPQSTALERAIDQTQPQWENIIAAMEPASVRANPSLQPWLAMQWQVAQFVRYFADTDALLTAALPWLFERGSAASVRRALGWLGYDQAVVIEEDGPLLHIDLGRPIKEWELAAVAHVIRASLPLHVCFWRAHHGYDLRPLRLDGAAGLDADLLDNDSGIPVDVAPWGHSVKLSQGQRRTTGSTAAPTTGVQAAQWLHITTVLTYNDRIVLDAWSLDSALLIDASLGATLVVSSISTAPQPGQALVVPRAEAFITTSAWQAPAASTCQHAHTASHTPQPHDNQRSWQGSWNAQPWRAHFETHTYEEQP